MKIIIVVGAIILHNEKILCAQRGPDKSLAHKWEFPGGKIESGESPQEALTREIQEEMKCEVAIGEQVAQTVHEYDFGTVDLTTFYCELIGEEPQLTEHAAIQWLHADELMMLDWAPADIPVVKQLVDDFT